MRLLRLSALALVAECAYGYLDTTPFFMFSTSEYAFEPPLPPPNPGNHQKQNPQQYKLTIFS